MKRIAMFALPIGIIVYFMSMWWLNRFYTDIEPNIRTYLAIGAALLSAIISFFMFKADTEDSHPAKQRRKQ
jgi:hypothetical protein